MKNRNVAFILAFFAAFIYGVSFTVAKEVMPLYIKPFGFILLRVSGATLLFWLISFSIPYEKINPKDFRRIILASIFGVAINMLMFFKGLSMTTPINGSVIMVTTPILVLLFSFIILKDPVTYKKLIGVSLGLIGAVLLITYGQKPQFNAPNIRLGNFLVFINATSYSIYLIMAKSILNKYHPIHFIKWMYLFGLIWVFPFGIKEVMDASWYEMPQIAYVKIGFVVIFTTFLTYLFNVIALKNLKPTTLSVFIYLQPLIASIYAIFVGSDKLTFVKLVAASLIFTGVYMVSYRKLAE